MKPFKATYQGKGDEEIVLIIDFLRDENGLPVAIFIHNMGNLDWDELLNFTHCQIPWN